MKGAIHLTQVTTTYGILTHGKSKQESALEVDYPLIFNEFNLFFEYWFLMESCLFIGK